MESRRLDLALVDTNVLVYASDAMAPQHKASLRLRDAIVEGELQAAVTVQNLLEFYSVVTNSKLKSPRSPSDAKRELLALAEYLTVLPTPENLAILASDQAARFGLRRADIFDAAIAVTALASGVRTIFTYDPAVFERFPNLEVCSPDAWRSSAEPTRGARRAS